jgi:hypothetical protein
MVDPDTIAAFLTFHGGAADTLNANVFHAIANAKNGSCRGGANWDHFGQSASIGNRDIGPLVGIIAHPATGEISVAFAWGRIDKIEHPTINTRLAIHGKR